jgi:peptidoglycan L-alanyl-D-glutamate endopeptidase CwlK
MPIKLGARSEKALVGVHPDLVRVIRRAAADAPPELDFMLLEGVRTHSQMCVNYGKGRTQAQCLAKGVAAAFAKPNERKVTWLNNPFNSNHRLMADGFGHAIDAAPFPIDWNNSKRFQALAELILAAAKAEGVHVRWGRDWDEDGRYEEKGETDGPHFELVGA